MTLKITISVIFFSILLLCCQNADKGKKIDSKKSKDSLVHINKSDSIDFKESKLFQSDLYKSFDNNNWIRYKNGKYYETKPKDITEYTKTLFLISFSNCNEFSQTAKKNGKIKNYFWWIYDSIPYFTKLKIVKSDSSVVFDNRAYKGNQEEKASFKVLIDSIHDINSYLLFSGYFEGHSFDLYNKTDGKHTNSMIGFPCFSPNRKRIVAFNSNGYEPKSGEMEVYNISPTGQIIRQHYISFEKWMPIEEPFELTWIDENSFIIKVQPIVKYYKKDGNINHEEPYFLKIKIQ